MKLRSLFILACSAVLLTACNFTLAADVTPPPGYVAPTPMPPLAPYPPVLPDVRNGEAIYAQKCLPCHGPTGLGDGPQGKQLPVTVAPIGLPDFARKALPSAWFKQVTRGNIERMMPPFVSLSEEERWNVVAYALTIHVAPGQIEKGRELFEANCSGCAAKFSDLEKMYALSENDLIALIKNGEGDIPAFGKDYSDAEAAAVAVYLRTLTFAAPAAATPVPSATPMLTATPTVEITATPNGTESATPSAEATPVSGTPNGTESAALEGTVTAAVNTGSVKGSVENKTGKALPSDAKVILYGYEHGGDPSQGPKEVLKLEGTLNADGTFLFENVEILEARIFVAEVVVGDMSYNTGFVSATPEMTEIVLPSVTLYGITTDLTNLKMDNVAIRFDFAAFGEIKASIIYAMYNKGDKTILVNLENNNQDIPFIKAPLNSEFNGFQTTQDSAQFTGTQDQSGFYLSPTEQVYGLILFAKLSKNKETDYSQKFVLPVGTVRVLVPEGVTISGDKFTDEGVTPIQDSNGQPANFQIYSTKDVKAGDTLTFTITGEPKTGAAPAPADTSNKGLLIGVGVVGGLLILLGAWLFMRDRNQAGNEESDDEDEEDDEDDDEDFEDSESVMDAIIALDDLHRAGKISDAAYQKRREELKSKLKRK